MKKTFLASHRLLATTISFLILFTFMNPTFAKNNNDKDFTDFAVKKILKLEINSSINPATLSYIKHGISKAEKENFGSILIVLSTPGGLISTTKDLLHSFGSSQVPIIIWVAPDGASATSAGAIMSAGAHVLAMAPGTNIGAATPIQINKDIQKDAKNKILNDLVALTQSLSKTHGRNGALFKQMIVDGASYQAQEAYKNHLIDLIVSEEHELLEKLDQRKIQLQGKNVKLQVSKQVNVVELAMDMGQKILDMFANPSMAYILFLIGAALLYFELQAPGGFVAGSIGAICLLLAGIGFQVLPLNFGALGLIVLSFILFILEIYILSYGLLTAAGLTALLFGSLFLFRSSDGYLHMQQSLIYSSVFGVAVFLLFIFLFIAKDLRKKKKENFFNLVGAEGVIIFSDEEKHSHNEYYYKVKIKGEIWKAKSTQLFKEGDEIVVTEQDKEKLEVSIDKI